MIRNDPDPKVNVLGIKDVSLTSQLISYVQYALSFGLLSGSLSAQFLAKYGKWTCLVIAATSSLIGGMTAYYQNYVVLLVGKFFAGFAGGLYSFSSPKFISECSPKEISGPAGAIFNVALNFGLWLNAFIAFCFAETINKDMT